MKKIITLLVLLANGAVTYATNSSGTTFVSDYNDDHTYEMRVSQLTDLVNSVKGEIYGYDNHGGGVSGNIDYFKKNYLEKYNAKLQNKGLVIEKENKDIIFKYKCDTTDTITIELLKANYDTNNGWCPSGVAIKVQWIVGAGYVAPTAVEENIANSDEITYTVQEIDTKNAPNHQTDWTTITLYLLIGINLIVLIVLCQAVRNIKHILMRINALSSTESQTSTQASTKEEEINNLAKQIDKLLDNDVVLKRTLTALEKALKEISEKQKQVEAPQMPRSQEEKATVASNPQPPVYKEEEIGDAGFDEDDKCLSCNAKTVVLFKITKITQEYKFSLIDSEEVRNFIETQSAMLDQYKQWNVIAYDKLVNNGKVSVVNKGELRRIDDNSYEVISPLYLKFE